MSNISRRSFLKGALAGTASIAALGLTGITALAEEPLYTPGTYSARAQGYGGFVTVTMTFSENEITDCVIDATSETPHVGGVAIEEYVEAVMAEQKIDAVTSATADYSLGAAKRAAANCVAQAQGQAEPLDEKPASAEVNETSADWLGQEPEIAEDSIVETIDVDVLVVGDGCGGAL